jgi:putative hydrolase of the HAD superfamily
MIKAVLFDLDDTLLWDKKSVREAFHRTCLEAQKRYDLDPDKLEEEVRGAAREVYSSYETYAFTQMIGINPFEGLWGDFTDIHNIQFRKMNEIVPEYRTESWTRGLKQLGIDDEAFGHKLGELFPTMRRQVPFVYEDTFSVLDTLREEFRLLLLTNGSPSLQNEKLRITPELVPYFEHILVSGAFGRGKPDQAIFEHALFLLSLSKEDVVMVGDNLHTDIIGANRTGIRSVWINRTGMKRVQGIEPDLEIGSLSELPDAIRKLSS